jgi:hypothetical protein
VFDFGFAQPLDIEIVGESERIKILFLTPTGQVGRFGQEGKRLDISAARKAAVGAHDRDSYCIMVQRRKREGTEA